jgi:putative DNA primase/helicase
LAATAGEEALLAAGLPIYQRGQILVQPVTTEVPASRGRMTQMAGLAKLNVHNIVDKLCQTAKWERFDARAGRWVRANPSPQVANIILSRHGQWLVPTVAGVITTPTLRNDGTILSDPGYDAKTRLYHVADSNLILSSDVHEPSRAAAEKSLALLSELLSEFPFVNFKENGKPDREVAKAVALSALITPVVRGALSVVPAHAFRANTAGSGKSYLADVASAISSGRPCPVISAGPDEAETEKRIAGLLLAGYPLISIDNVNGELGGDLLCQAIERPLIRIRPLGKSDINEIESASTIFCTGNQLRVRGDMVRRTLVCDLDAGVERPELRTFRSDPVAKVLADRSTYVSACLTIVRAYLAAPDHIRLPPLASFGDWSDLVRSALVWLGCADPVESMEAAREDDPELGELREVIGLWETAAALGEGVTAKALAKKAEQQHPSKCGEPMDFACPELRDVLLRVAGERGAISTRRLGQWLQKREGRIVGGRRIKRQRNAGGGLTRWALEIA